MDIPIIRKIMPSSLDGKSYNSTPQIQEWIVIHNTAGGTAKSNIDYFYNGADERYMCVHYVLDDKEIYQLLEDNWRGQHAGQSGRYWIDNPIDATECNNSNSIGIEVADGDSVDHLQAIENLIELIKYLMEQYDIDADHVIRHGDTQNKPCPATIMELGKWPYIKEAIKKQEEPIPEPTPHPNTNVYILDFEQHWFVDYKEIESHHRLKIVEMAKQILLDCDMGLAWYNTPSPRTVDYTKPQYSGGKVVYDESSLISCCYMNAGLTSMYAKSASGGTLIDEIVNNNGRMWLCDKEGIEKALPGDILVRTKASTAVTQEDMNTKIRIEHVYLYIGNKQLIHASGKSRGIVLNDLTDSMSNNNGYVFVRPKDLIDAESSNDKEMFFELRKYNDIKYEHYTEERQCKYMTGLPQETYISNELRTDWFLPMKEYSHIGKNIKAIKYMRDDIVDASWLFSECWYATNSIWFPYLNTEIIRDMSYMYYNCARLRELDLSEYNTENVQDMSHMFDSCIYLEILNLSNFNMDSVKKTDCMLMNCSRLKELRLDNCSKETIQKIIESKYFPVNDLEVLYKIYCKEENVIELVVPKGWQFIYIK